MFASEKNQQFSQRLWHLLRQEDVRPEHRLVQRSLVQVMHHQLRRWCIVLQIETYAPFVCVYYFISTTAHLLLTSCFRVDFFFTSVGDPCVCTLLQSYALIWALARRFTMLNRNWDSRGKKWYFLYTYCNTVTSTTLRCEKLSDGWELNFAVRKCQTVSSQKLNERSVHKGDILSSTRVTKTDVRGYTSLLLLFIKHLLLMKPCYESTLSILVQNEDGLHYNHTRFLFRWPVWTRGITTETQTYTVWAYGYYLRQAWKTSTITNKPVRSGSCNSDWQHNMNTPYLHIVF